MTNRGLKNIITNSFLLLILILFTGCSSIDGELIVTKGFKAIDKGSGKAKEVTISTGTYKPSLEFDKKKITLNFKNQGKHEVAMVINLPENAEIPQGDGVFDFYFSADEIGQPFDIEGKVQTTRFHWDERCSPVDDCYSGCCGLGGLGQRWDSEFYDYHETKIFELRIILPIEEGMGGVKVAEFYSKSTL